MRHIRRLILPIAAAAFATSAPAQTLGTSSTGSFNVTVVLAPIGPAIAASRAGANGLWTVTGGGRGLMVHAPETIASGATVNVSIYAPSTDAITIRPAQANLRVQRTGLVPQYGFDRQDFSIRGGDALARQPSGSTMFILGTI